MGNGLLIPIEIGGATMGVCAHVIVVQPVEASNGAEYHRIMKLVVAITSRTPYDASRGFLRLILLVKKFWTFTW